MDAIYTIIPIVLIIYYLRKAAFEPVYLLMVPMIFALGEAVFLQTWSFNMYIPVVYFPLFRNDIAFLLLLIIRLYIGSKRKRLKPLKKSSAITVLWILVTVYLFQIPYIWVVEGKIILRSFTAGFQFLYFPVSILVWVGTLRFFTRDEMWKLLKAVALLVVILSPLYILSAVGLRIYPGEAYMTLDVGGVFIIRDFLTFPLWTGLAISYHLIIFLEKGKIGLNLLALAILISSLAMTLTRSLLLAVSLQLIVVTILVYRGKGSAEGRKLKLALLILAVFFGVGLLQYVAPANMEALGSRIGTAVDEQGEESSVKARTDVLLYIMRESIKADPLYGFGYPATRKEIQGEIYQDIIWGDMMWFQLVAFTGLLGTAVIVVFFGISIKNAISIVKNSEDSAQYRMGLFLLLAMVYDFLRTTSSDSFFWLVSVMSIFFAMTIVEKHGLWLEPKHKKEMVPGSFPSENKPELLAEAGASANGSM